MLHLYPEDGDGTHLKHPGQGRKWAKEIDPTLAAPMARASDGRDYFVNEIAMAEVNKNVTPVIVARWFQRDGALVSKAHPVRLYAAGEEPAWVIDARPKAIIEVPLVSYLFCVEDISLCEVHEQWNIPPPERIHGRMAIKSLFLLLITSAQEYTCRHYTYR